MRRKSIFIIIAIMAIGFAATTAGIIINNTTTIGANVADFEVLFTRALLDEVDMSDDVISQDKKTITFVATDLRNIGDESVLKYDVINLSTQYDANVSLNVSVEENDYIRVTNSFDDSVLTSQETRTGLLKVELIKASTEVREFSVTIELEFDAITRDTIGDGELPDDEVEEITFTDESNHPLVNKTVTIGENSYTTNSSGKIYPILVNPYQKYNITINNDGIISSCSSALYILNKCNNVFVNSKLKKGIAYGNALDFTYTGKEQDYTVPLSGTYRIEVWGGQGGDSNYSSTNFYQGGYGGYAVGEVNLAAGDKLYLNVGGKGTSNNTCKGGYNGGGLCYINDNGGSVGAGGGATHVALVSGLLSTLENQQDKILIVAGGGGGSNYWRGGQWGYGGSGGGYIGENGNSSHGHVYGTGGTQESGGTGGAEAAFGLGAESYIAHGSAGGGGGYYGGGSSIDNAGGGGGSGYIGNYLLTNKKMFCYRCEESSNTNTFTATTQGITNFTNERDLINCPNGFSTDAISKCAKSGNGLIRISYLGKGYKVTFDTNGGTIDIISKVVSIGSPVGELPIPVRGTDTFDGWYYDENFNTRVDENYVPVGNILLHAKYITQ